MSLDWIDWAMIVFVAVAWVWAVWYSRKKRRESAQRWAELQKFAQEEFLSRNVTKENPKE